MAKSKKPRRRFDPYRAARLIKRPGLHEALVVFEPLYRLFRQLETGEVDAVMGRPVMPEKHGEMVEIAPALLGWSDLWDRMAKAEGLQLDLVPLRRIARKLSAVSPLTESDLEAGKVCLDHTYRAFMRLPPHKIRHHAAMEEIAINLQRAGLLRL
jgi:hypothetical protein